MVPYTGSCPRAPFPGTPLRLEPPVVLCLPAPGPEHPFPVPPAQVPVQIAVNHDRSPPASPEPPPGRSGTSGSCTSSRRGSSHSSRELAPVAVADRLLHRRRLYGKPLTPFLAHAVRGAGRSACRHRRPSVPCLNRATCRVSMKIGFASALPFADAGLADTSRAAGLGLVARLCTASRPRGIFGARSTTVSGGRGLRNRLGCLRSGLTRDAKAPAAPGALRLPPGRQGALARPRGPRERCLP